MVNSSCCSPMGAAVSRSRPRRSSSSPAKAGALLQLAVAVEPVGPDGLDALEGVDPGGGDRGELLGRGQVAFGQLPVGAAVGVAVEPGPPDDGVAAVLLGQLPRGVQVLGHELRGPGLRAAPRVAHRAQLGVAGGGVVQGVGGMAERGERLAPQGVVERAFPAGRLSDGHLGVGDGVQVAVGRHDAGAAHPLGALQGVRRGQAEGRRGERPCRRVRGGAFAELGLPRGRRRGEHPGVVADRTWPGCGEGGPVPVAHRALGCAAAVLEQPDAVAQHVGHGVRVVQAAAGDGLAEHRAPGRARPAPPTGPRPSDGRSRAHRPET